MVEVSLVESLSHGVLIGMAEHDNPRDPDRGSSMPENPSGYKSEDVFEKLPDHLLIEILVRVPSLDWSAASLVSKRWATLFKSDALWKSALEDRWPKVEWEKRWPGPIGRGSSKRRYTALHLSKRLLNLGEDNGDIEEVAGHAYLFLKEQLESTTPLTYNLLHGTVVDQFLACGKCGSVAQDLASQIWLAVIDNMDGTERTFRLLIRIGEEWEVFFPHVVQWKLLERLFRLSRLLTLESAMF